MAGAIDWHSLSVAAAFVLGAVLATVAMLRVVRAVIILLGEELRPRRWRRDHPREDGTPPRR